MLEFARLAIPDVLEVLPSRHGDDRGFFSETYKASAMAEIGITCTFIQDNESFSRNNGTLRGLHYQLAPFAQDKLVRVPQGRILDVAVDIRKQSPTFGRWVSLEVSAERGNQIFVPKGFAHGFVTLEPDTLVQYKVSAAYSRDHDRSIHFADRYIGIDWPIPVEKLTLSSKDQAAARLSEQDPGF